VRVEEHIGAVLGERADGCFSVTTAQLEKDALMLGTTIRGKLA
jgi:hypothetical protein